MADVVFAFWSFPGVPLSKAVLPSDDALEVARLLELQDTLASRSAAAKIRAQAKCGADHSETRGEVELTPQELLELAAMLDDESWPGEQLWYEHMREEVHRHAGLRERD